MDYIITYLSQWSEGYVFVLLRNRAGVLVSFAIAASISGASALAQSPTILPALTVTSGYPVQDPRSYTSATNHTATKTDTPSLEVPFSIQSVTRELLDERKPWDFAKALETVPGVSIGYGGGFTQSGRTRIRGFTNISNFKDGYRVNAQASEVDLANVQSIDVLKGPASALYGRFEPGGVINLVTKDPVATRRLDGQISAGSFGFVRGTIDAGGTIDDEGILTTRFNGAFETSDGFRDFTNYDRYFLAPAFNIRFSESTKLTVKAEFLRLDAAFDRGLPNNPVSLLVPPSRNYGAPWMRLDKSQWLTMAELNHQFSSDWRLKVGGQMAQTDVRESYFNYGFFAPVVGNNLTRSFVAGTEQTFDRTAQVELYGNVATGPVRHKLLFGVEYNHDTWSFSLGQTAAPAVNIWAPQVAVQPLASSYVPSNIGSYKYESLGFYAQDELAFGPLRLLAGGRFDRVRGEIADYVTGPNPAESDAFWTFAPRVGLTYMVTPELAVYGSWAQSTRLELDQGFLATGQLPLPTKGQQFEAGIKGNFWNGRLQPTVAFFDISKTNAIVPSLVNPLFVTQVGELKVQGVEVEVAARPVDPWRLIASFTYLNAYISQDTNQLLVGNQLQGVPAYEASLWTSYNFGTEERGFTVGGGVFYSSDRPTSNANNLYIPAYTRLDLFASYRFNNRTELQLNIDNVTDQRYYLVGGFSLITPQPPLGAFLTLKHKLF